MRLKYYLIISLLFIISHDLFAQASKSLIGIGVKAMYKHYTGDQINLFDVDVDVYAANQINGSIEFILRSKSPLSLKFGFSYGKSKFYYESQNVSIEMGEFTQIPIYGTLRFDFPTRTIFFPFIGFGGAIYINSISNNKENVELIYGAGNELRIKNSFGFHIDGGITFVLQNNYELEFLVKYNWVSAEAKSTNTDFEKVNVSLNSFLAGMGFRFNL